MVVEAFYEWRGGNRFRSTTATTGPWDARFQHGGPPAALVARALAALGPPSHHRLARLTVDILRPVPVAEVRVRTRTLRASRQASLVTGVLEADDQEVLRITGWRLAPAAGGIPAVAEPAGPPPLPPPGPQVDWPHAGTDGLISAVEWRFVSGAPGIPGPAQVWARPRPALVAGTETSGLERALIVADSGHGLSAVLDAGAYLFINVDLTLLLHRHPVGDWIFLEAGTVISPSGVGMAETRLSDRQGRAGSCLQTLLVAPRRA
jgi:hypothetical protein